MIHLSSVTKELFHCSCCIDLLSEQFYLRCIKVRILVFSLRRRLLVQLIIIKEEKKKGSMLLLRSSRQTAAPG